MKNDELRAQELTIPRNTIEKTIEVPVVEKTIAPIKKEEPMVEKQIEYDDILDILDKQLNTFPNKIYINSLDTSLVFKEVTVKEQKTLTKLIIENENNDAVLYEASLAMISSLIINRPSNFNIFSINEFDRTKLMVGLYKQNFIDDKINVKCKNTDCNKEFIYNVDYDKIVKKLDEFDTSDQIFKYDTEKHYIEIVYNFPNVNRVKNYLKCLVADRTSKKEEVKITPVEYLDLFIKTCKLVNKETQDTIMLDLTKYSIRQIETILEKLPQSVLFDKDHGLMTEIAKNCLLKLKSVQETIKCPECGSDIIIDIGINDFFK